MTDRYEIQEKIASGDFATVYRGRDRELEREVAIKQIHAQFLAEKDRLDRYWKEAQLLASLEHPHVVTIYDLVRRRGQLVLELMRGSLKDKTQGQPLNLDYLRIALFHSLQALKFLHSKGVIHGDVKPSNLLIDKRGRIKLGDFGMARRADNDDGSLLKGTTKYMAPEVVSDQFGRVGPHSDLYSLGFTAYELLCGENFETLFPGLNAFGRDKQAAWMMWHAAADRKLPDINRVMEGVPENLAHIIQRLTAKNRAQRYATADQALADLMRDPAVLNTTPAAEDEPITPTPAQKRKRQLVIVAFAASCLLSIGIAIPWGGEARRKTTPEVEPGRGIIRSVLTSENRLIVEMHDKPQELLVRSADRIFLNDRVSLLRELREGDVVTLRNFTDEAGQRHKELAAFRPETARGTIERIESEQGRLVMTIGEGDQRGQALPLDVPNDSKLQINGSSEFLGNPVLLADLQPGDRVEVTHVERETGRVALSVIAMRLVPQTGIVRAVDVKKRELTLALDEGQNAKLWTLPIAEKCAVTINGRQFLGNQLLVWRDLKPGDKVTVEHDTQIARVDAVRQFDDAGEIHAVKFDPPLIQVFLRGQSQSKDYRVPVDCEITLGGEKVDFSVLRRGDEVVVTHGTAEGSTPTPRKIEAIRPVDRRRWALLIPISKHDDDALTPAPHADENASLVKEMLLKRHRVPADQCTLLADESFIRLEQGIPASLAKIPDDGQLIVYVAGQAFVDADGNAYLAPRDFNLRRTSVTGLPVAWLVEQLEACKAREKLLLWDVGPATATADPTVQPAAADLIDRLQSGSKPLLLKTTTTIAGSRRGQRDRGMSDGQHGRFAWFLAQGLSGQADKNRDNRLEVTELFEYVEEQLAGVARPNDTQSAVLFLPNSVPPPRISAEAKQAVRAVLVHVGRSKLDSLTLTQEYEKAAGLIGQHPEAKLAYALVLYRHRKLDEAIKPLEEIRVSNPNVWPAHQLWSWIQFTKRNWVSGLTGLAQLATQAKPPKDAEYRDEMLRMFEWIGAMREYATLIGAGDNSSVSQQAGRVDSAMEQQGGAALVRYQQGRKYVHSTWESYGKQIEAADTADQPKLRLESRLLTSYVNFDLDEAQAQLVERMNE